MSGVFKHLDLEELCNGLDLELYECSEANFHCSCDNAHSYNRIFFVCDVQGSPSTIQQGEQRKEMKPGYSYFLVGGKPYRFCFKQGTHFLAFHFHLRLFRYLEIFLGENVFAEHAGKMERTKRLLQLMQQNESEISTICELKSLILAEAVEFIPAGKKSTSLRNLSKHLPLFQYIRTTADARTTLDTLAEMTGISPDTLSRSFSRDYGIPLKRYLITELVSKAEQKLRNPQWKIREIAHQLNFNDEYYFSKFFKKETGIAPGEFRKQLLSHQVYQENK